MTTTSKSGLRSHKKIPDIKPGEKFDRGGGTFPDGTTVRFYMVATAATGFGRWVWCKYCYGSHKPIVGSEQVTLDDGPVEFFQVCCSGCGYGLSEPSADLNELRKEWADRIIWKAP